MNAQCIGFLVVSAILATVLGAMMLLSRRDELTVQRARDLIANPAQFPASGQMIFRKPKLSGYMLILAFIFALATALFSVIHSRGVMNIAGLRAGIVVIAFLFPLAMGIRSLKYIVRISNDELTISDLATRSVALQDIIGVNGHLEDNVVLPNKADLR